MIVNRSIKIDDVSVQKNTVASTMFGANTLQSVNTTDGGVQFENYETAITLAGVTNLRFPGGTGEVLNNLLVGSTSDTLAPDLEFLSGSELGSVANFGVTLDPYEVVQITLNHRNDPNAGAAFSDSNTQADTETNPPAGVVLTGDLKLESTQFAGADQSNQELWVTSVVQATKSTGASNDNLVGTNGDDRLNAGAGNDTLTGGGRAMTSLSLTTRTQVRLTA